MLDTSLPRHCRPTSLPALFRNHSGIFHIFMLSLSHRSHTTADPSHTYRWLLSFPLLLFCPNHDSTGLFSLVLLIPYYLTNGSLWRTGITAGPELSGLAAWLAGNPGLAVLE